MVPLKTQPPLACISCNAKYHLSDDLRLSGPPHFLSSDFISFDHSLRHHLANDRNMFMLKKKSLWDSTSVTRKKLLSLSEHKCNNKGFYWLDYKMKDFFSFQRKFRKSSFWIELRSGLIYLLNLLRFRVNLVILRILENVQLS